MIAAVGHTDLTGDTLERVESELRAALARLPAPAQGLVRAGAGVPVAFGRAARATGHDLVVLTPTQGLVPALLPERDRPATGELLLLARQVRLLPYDPADRNACVAADERMIAECRRLFAVWDGSPSNGRDATAHLVAYARAHGIEVEVVWPENAARETTPGSPPRPAGRRPHAAARPAAVVGPAPVLATGKAEHRR
ncbi:hypothetical protein [Streptomyces panaciradicis]|uniref:hypothetical protein n=1 Tax=Streptomyces panaciradicis TaxID=1470261 RepID=UPI00355656DE